MPNNYFSIRDSGVITCYVATEFESITEIIAALAKAFRHPMVNPREPEAEKAHLLTHSGAQFQPITEEVWRAHVEALKNRSAPTSVGGPIKAGMEQSQ